MLKVFVIFISISVIYVLSNTPKNFGPFSLKLIESKQCKGPKRRDCSDVTTTIKGESKVKFDIIVKENTSPSNGKVIVANEKEVLKMQLKKPCDFVLLRPVLSSTMNITKDCVVLKGHYQFNVDVESIAQTFYGGMFIYGNWTFRSLLYSDKCNFSCIVMQASIIRRNNTN